MKLFAGVALITALVTIPHSAFALDEQIKNYRGIRSAGMGGVITTTGNFAEALFGNPARLSAVDVSKLTLLEITTEVNSNILSDAGALSDITGASGASQIVEGAKIMGRNQHLRLQVLSAYYNPKFIGDMGFGFGLLASVQTNLLVNYTTEFDTMAIADVGPVMGFSYPFLEGALLAGFNLKTLFRAAIYDRITSLDFLTGKKLEFETFGHQGVGIDADLGGYYRVPWNLPFMRLNVGASISNLFKSHYDEFSPELLSGLKSRPPNNDRVLNIGTRLDFPDTWIFTAPLLAIEFQDLGSTTHEMSWAKSLHIGTEGKLSRAFAVRVGLNQGYLAAGIGLELPLLKIDLATYGEELSGTAGEQEDRRFMLKIAFEI